MSATAGTVAGVLGDGPDDGRGAVVCGVEDGSAGAAVFCVCAVVGPGPNVTGALAGFEGFACFVALAVDRCAAGRAGDSFVAAGLADTTCFATGRFSTR
jgi:hypothetical protein